MKKNRTFFDYKTINYTKLLGVFRKPLKNNFGIPSKKAENVNENDGRTKKNPGGKPDLANLIIGVE